MKIEQGQRDEIWLRVERYLDWKSQMVVVTSNLNMRLELQDHEDRLVQIRDMLIDMQAELRKDARKDFADRTDRMEGDE